MNSVNNKLNSDSPIIVFGMHRSGTSLLGRILNRLSVFTGCYKDINDEAIFYQNINNWLLRSSGATWDNPLPIKYLTGNPHLAQNSVDYIKHWSSLHRQYRFVGLRNYLSGAQSYSTWGWKDPRNTFTIPFWKQIYPNARYIYIERHPVDVASSLYVRNTAEFKINSDIGRVKSIVNSLRIKSGGFCGSARCSSLYTSYEIWKEYVEESNKIMSTLPKSNFLKISYEELCTEPAKVAASIADRFNLQPKRSLDIGAELRIDPKRASAFTAEEKLVKFNDEIKEDLIGFRKKLSANYD